nr:MAG TPA: hypothetical protein [Caudoviricetes sp.]
MNCNAFLQRRASRQRLKYQFVGARKIASRAAGA